MGGKPPLLFVFLPFQVDGVQLFSQTREPLKPKSFQPPTFPQNLPGPANCVGTVLYLSNPRLAPRPKVANTRPAGRLGPPPCFIWPGILFLPSGSAELLAQVKE